MAPPNLPDASFYTSLGELLQLVRSGGRFQPARGGRRRPACPRCRPSRPPPRSPASPEVSHTSPCVNTCFLVPAQHRLAPPSTHLFEQP